MSRNRFRFRLISSLSQHDQEREKSELEVIEATRVLINDRIPALAKELDAIRTEDFQEVYSRSSTSPLIPIISALFLTASNCVVKEELDPNKIIRFLTLVNLESRMHAAGINIRHMGRLRQLVSNTSMRHFILCAVRLGLGLVHPAGRSLYERSVQAVSRALKHKLRNKMRKAVRQKRQGEYATPRRSIRLLKRLA